MGRLTFTSVTMARYTLANDVADWPNGRMAEWPNGRMADWPNDCEQGETEA